MPLRGGKILPILHYDGHVQDVAKVVWGWDDVGATYEFSTSKNGKAIARISGQIRGQNADIPSVRILVDGTERAAATGVSGSEVNVEDTGAIFDLPSGDHTYKLQLSVEAAGTRSVTCHPIEAGVAYFE